MRLSRILHLLDLTPREAWRLLRRRLPVLRAGPAWTADELLQSAKHVRGIRYAEHLLRHEAIARRHVGWKQLDFAGRRVVEIGCGPLAGYGPLAVFCGAASYQSAEPEWSGDLFFSEAVTSRYLKVLHADLTALYGERMSFPEFRTALRERMLIHVAPFDAAPIEGPVDVVLSQSVLEHVFPPEAVIDKLVAIHGPATRHLHLVDFGNHYPTAHAFDGLYDQDPDAYIRDRGKAINLLRVPDILRLFQSRGLPAVGIPIRALDVDPVRVSPWWRRYETDDLRIQLALICVTGSGVS